MRKSLAILAFIFFNATFVFAQDIAPNSTNSTPDIVKPSRDFLMLQLGYNNWTGQPDSVKVKGVGYAFNGFLCYDFPLKKTHLSFATGLGVSVNVVYFNQQRISFNDTVAATSGEAHFYSSTDKRDKFVTTYLQAPFELRYFSNMKNRNKGFKAAVGLQIGTLLGAHLKEVNTVSGVTVNEKINSKRYLSTWNFAATARVGLGNFAIYGSYNLTDVFKDKQGPPATPYSIGLCITGL